MTLTVDFLWQSHLLKRSILFEEASHILSSGLECQVLDQKLIRLCSIIVYFGCFLSVLQNLCLLSSLLCLIHCVGSLGKTKFEGMVVEDKVLVLLDGTLSCGY